MVACHRNRLPEALRSCPDLRVDEGWESIAHSAVNGDYRCDSSSLACATAQASPMKAPTTREDKRGDRDGCDPMRRSQNRYSSINSFRCALAKVRCLFPILHKISIVFLRREIAKTLADRRCAGGGGRGQVTGSGFASRLCWNTQTVHLIQREARTDFFRRKRMILSFPHPLCIVKRVTCFFHCRRGEFWSIARWHCGLQCTALSYDRRQKREKHLYLFFSLLKPLGSLSKRPIKKIYGFVYRTSPSRRVDMACDAGATALGISIP